MAPTAVNEKKPCCHWPMSATRSLRQKSSLTKRATPGLTDINEPKGEEVLRNSRKQESNKYRDELAHLGSAVEIPPSSLWANGNSDSHLEPSKPRCGTGRYQDSTAGGPGMTKRSLNRIRSVLHLDINRSPVYQLQVPTKFIPTHLK